MKEKFKSYYENLIDDIKDKSVKDKLLDKLEDLDDEVFMLDCEISEELENQKNEYIDEFGLQDEFNYSCSMPVGEMRPL